MTVSPSSTATRVTLPDTSEVMLTVRRARILPDADTIDSSFRVLIASTVTVGPSVFLNAKLAQTSPPATARMRIPMMTFLRVMN